MYFLLFNCFTVNSPSKYVNQTVPLDICPICNKNIYFFRISVPKKCNKPSLCLIVVISTFHLIKANDFACNLFHLLS